MERQLWNSILALLAALDTMPPPTRFDFGDRQIVAVYYWSVIHDRPTSWACQKRHWPLHLRQQALPSPATMSRRLRTPTVMALLDPIIRLFVSFRIIVSEKILITIRFLLAIFFRVDQIVHNY